MMRLFMFLLVFFTVSVATAKAQNELPECFFSYRTLTVTSSDGTSSNSSRIFPYACNDKAAKEAARKQCIDWVEKDGGDPILTCQLPRGYYERNQQTEADRAPASLPKLVIGIAKSLNKVKGGIEKIQQVKSLVQEIEMGKNPSVRDNPWASLAEDYKSIAEELETAPLPTDFDAKQYAVSLDDFRRCSTRPRSLQKLEGYLSELRDAVARGESALADIQEFESEATKARVALHYLIRVHDKLVNVPIYGEIFQWNWFELNNSVLGKLNRVDSAITKHKRKITENNKLIKEKVSNLESNLTSIKDLPCQS